MSQYLTTVQSMPKEIETEILKIIRKFLWDRKSVNISLNQMYLPIKEGGLGIVDIEARNEAIKLMWTKRFLTIGKERPMWAYIADELIKQNLPKTGKKHNARLTENQNPFTQSWAPAMHAKTKLPKDIHKFLKIANKTQYQYGSHKNLRESEKGLTSMVPHSNGTTPERPIQEENNGMPNWNSQPKNGRQPT